ncbi:hypothetical protein SAMN04244571_04775 [Azotobacter beijerinckii]|uniref:Uncharacterized protein n=1 Tax=Azotobacter beijerinckii TaxID=170623 RepID=A0A1I1CXP4_9GAMM|nr:hypothetical protein SAMN04244571_04775 [Azotobacter beijerinckii]
MRLPWGQGSIRQAAGLICYTIRVPKSPRQTCPLSTLTLSKAFSGIAQKVVGIEQSVGNLRAPLQPTANGGRDRLAGFAAQAG